METFKDSLNFPFKAQHPFRIIIVGAGIAGLSAAIGLKLAGHDVQILEQVHEIAEVGAGIQMAPNAARIMGRFGLLEKIMEKANVLDKNSLRRWEDDRELGAAPLMPSVSFSVDNGLGWDGRRLMMMIEER
jgi:salicylate hydroxylase